jgi:hypothetical protein
MPRRLADATIRGIADGVATMARGSASSRDLEAIVTDPLAAILPARSLPPVLVLTA